jgi:hypothetical protein
MPAHRPQPHRQPARLVVRHEDAPAERDPQAVGVKAIVRLAVGLGEHIVVLDLELSKPPTIGLLRERITR